MDWALVLSTVAILFTGITAIFSILAYTTVVGIQKSTHQVQWMPVQDKDNPNPTGMDLAKQFAGLQDEIDQEYV